MKARLTLLVIGLVAALNITTVLAEVATLRDKAPIAEQPAVEAATGHEVLGQSRTRAWPMQAPTIPHSTEGFSITKEFNQCLMCHNAQMAPAMKAPAVGVSHYQNRDGRYLNDVSPRRFFCDQCHVPQFEDAPAVANIYQR
ncbi:MAG: nitrate reductase cytochrome c-type subunit; periplasmic nitrate reductase electron transfer subunit [Halioglobus sp.]|nr:nitrate reductase cytochrome c-type subunit; periplasmic nitrate reductase electron transfer subunit [Halioglobus sp.]